MNIFVEKLRKHLIYPSWNITNERYLDGLTNHYYCQAEHHMIGSTTISVDFPWIPYALLAGRPIEEVNERRMKADLFPMPACRFGLLEGMVFVKLSPADPKTLEVPEPTIVKVRRNSDDTFYEESYWKGKTYMGPFHDVGRVITERRK